MNKSLRNVTMLVAGSLLMVAGAAQAKYRLSPEEQMAHALSLSEEQQLQVADAKQDFDETLHAARIEFKEKVDAILTEEQKAKRDEMADKVKAHMEQRKKDKMMKMHHHDKRMRKGEDTHGERPEFLNNNPPEPVILPAKVIEE